MDEWCALLPPDLIASAYKANNELAWKRQDALRIIEILRSRCHVVLGVDVWLPTEPGPTIPMYVYDWDISTEDRRARTAGDFVERFAWSPEDTKNAAAEPYFNLTVGDR